MTLSERAWFGDVVIVGAGPAGSAAASILSREGKQVSIISDSRRHSWAGETLPPGSSELVSEIFGNVLDDGHLRAYATRAAWETAELQETDALANPLSSGWLLDRARFDRDIHNAVTQSGALVLEGHARWTRQSDGTWQVKCGEALLNAPFLIDATGRTSAIARRMGARRIELRRMLACIRFMHDSGDSTQATTIESVDEGWWYSTPIPGGGRVFALISDADLVPRGESREIWWDEALAASSHINQLLPPHKGSPVRDTPIVLSPAGTGWLDTLFGDGWASVGDSAAHFDPLSSQGLLTGILMGARLGQAFVENNLTDWERDYHMLIEEHVTLSAHYYGLVDRHPLSTFWQRRTIVGGN